MALRDLTLNFEDKTISNTFKKGKELIIQKVILALQCWLGDWYLDGLDGIDYEKRMYNKSLLLADTQSTILSVDGVVSVQNIEAKIDYDGPNKTLKVFKINADIITEDTEQVVLNGLIPIVGTRGEY